MPAKTPKLQPSTREKTCQVCGTVYTYPSPGSLATRHYCELCEGLPTDQRKAMTRMARRIQTLERSMAKLQDKTS